MNIDQLGRDAGRAIDRATVDADGDALARLQDVRDRRRRNQRVAAGAVAITLTVVSIAVGARLFSRGEQPTPASSLPGGTILYGAWDEKTSQAEWFAARPDGAHARALGITATCAEWFPDGRHIFVTNDAALSKTQPLRPAIVDADGSHLRPLDATTDQDLDLGCGDVSPDGSRLVLEGFGARKTLNGVYTVSATDGGDIRRLTAGRDSYPRYAPDGSEVVFLRTKSGVQPAGAGALFIVPADGGKVHRISPWDAAFLNYSWSPDGTWIAFEHPYGEIDLVRPDGTDLHRVPIDVPAGAGATNPAWSPDGRWIVFSLKRADGGEIWAVRPDGTGLQRLVARTASDLSAPKWTP